MCVFFYLSSVDNFFFGFEAKLELYKKKITIKNMINSDVKHVRFYERPTRDFAFTCVLSVDTYVSLFSDKFIKLPNLLLYSTLSKFSK